MLPRARAAPGSAGSSAGRGDAGAGVELTNRVVPCRHERENRFPERLISPGIEVGERDTLLLDPRVVTEVENAAAIRIAAVDHMIGVDRSEMLGEDATGRRLVELAVEVALHCAR